jgi:hypothetical protein
MLRLRVNDWFYSYEGIGDVYKIEDDSWTEYGTTWNNRPQEVGTLVTQLEDPYFIGFGGGDWVEVDVSEYTTPGAVNNFVIRDDLGNAEFRSRESANPPELVVMRCGGCGGCTGATPFVAASSSLSTVALALIGAILPKRRGRRKMRRRR